MRKIAVISDIHGNLPALEAVIADIKSRQIDRIFNLGDHISGPLYPKETIQYLTKQDWVHIRGNHDRQLIEQSPRHHGASDKYAFSFLGHTDLEWLKALPANLPIENEFFLFHGTPHSDTTYLLETVAQGKVRLATSTEMDQRLKGVTSRIMLCGHTHIPRIIEIHPKILIINPGSVGLPAYEDITPEYHMMETGSNHARYAVIEHINGNWQEELLDIPYDHQKAADRARKNGRPDWEFAIRTGSMPHKE